MHVMSKFLCTQFIYIYIYIEVAYVRNIQNSFTNSSVHGTVSFEMAGTINLQ